jgi:kinesin family protein 3/17
MKNREDKGEILIQREGDVEAPKQFTFDKVFDENTDQEQLFENTARHIVGSVIEGYNGTIFAYGQTGTGKTHTMEGELSPPEMKGVMSRCFEAVYNCIEGFENAQFLVRASYLEIYKENVRDLLSSNPKNKLIMHEKPDTGIYVKDLSSFICKSSEEMQAVQDTGRKNKSMGETKMNARSSRSHSVFTLTLECSELGKDGKDHIRVGKLNMVDLAGSERQSKTNATGQRLEEAIKINLSLTCLCQVISALTDSKASYVPYRDSQLTRMLQDSLGGNTKTVMIANIGPADYNFEETVNTLRWASRAKSIQNKPRINEDPKDAMIREFQDEIHKLRAQLEMIQDGKDPGQILGIVGGKPQIIEKVIKKKDEKKIKELEERLVLEKENIKKQAEEERSKIEQQMNMAEDEKQAVLKVLREKEDEEEKAKTKQQQLIKKLKKMEEKVVVGTQVIEEAKKQAKELKKTRKVLEKENNRRAKLEEEKKIKDDELIKINKKFGNLTEELDYITKKLHKVWNKYQGVQGEVQEVQEEFYRDRQDMYDTIFELDTQLKLKTSIIDNFIPEDETKKVMDQAKWNDELNDWVLKPPKKFQKKKGGVRPVSAVGMKRPTSEYSRIAKGLGDVNPRFKFENILELDLDMPERTTEDYQGQVAERVQSAINMILGQNDEENAAAVPIEQLINFNDEVLNEPSAKSKHDK